MVSFHLKDPVQNVHFLFLWLVGNIIWCYSVFSSFTDVTDVFWFCLFIFLLIYVYTSDILWFPVLFIITYLSFIITQYFIFVFTYL